MRPGHAKRTNGQTVEIIGINKNGSCRVFDFDTAKLKTVAEQDLIDNDSETENE